MSGSPRVALVGAGPRGRALARALNRHPDCRFVAVCDRDPAALAAVITVGDGRLAGYPDVVDMLAAERIDALVVATPPGGQAELAAAALRRGVHTLVECPMVSGAREADLLREAAEGSGAVASLAESFCYFPAVQGMRRVLRSSGISTVLAGEGCYVEMDALAAGEGWRAGYEMSRYLTHGLGPLLYLTGDRAESVIALEPQGRRTRADGPLLPMALVRTTSGAVHYVANSGLAPRPVNRWSVTGERSSVESDPRGRYDGDLRVYDHDGGGWRDEPLPMAQLYGDLLGLGREPERLMIRRFVATTLGGRPDLDLETSLTIGLAGVAAAVSARRDGERVRVADADADAGVGADAGTGAGTGTGGREAT